METFQAPDGTTIVISILFGDAANWKEWADEE
jgi:hypothetical protein